MLITTFEYPNENHFYFPTFFNEKFIHFVLKLLTIFIYYSISVIKNLLILIQIQTLVISLLKK